MSANDDRFTQRYVGCLILTQDHRLLLQQRGNDWIRFPGYLCEFGGRIEGRESPLLALVRELKEELGVSIPEDEVVYLSKILEGADHFEELVYEFFWHDKLGQIKNCYEGEPRYFNHIDEVLAHPKVMPSVLWLLDECRKQGLI